MKLAIKNSLLTIAIAVFLFQCQKSESPVEAGNEHHEETHGGHKEGEGQSVVELSDVQLANAGVEYGSLDSLNISDFVKVNGNLDLPPQNVAAVSAPMDGFVKKANYLVGNYVKKGAVLAVLEHLDYVKLQEEYLNLITNLDYLESEYRRQRRLDSAQVTSKKQFQAASAAFKSAQTRKKALEKQLQYMGLSPDRVAQGEISSTISIRAPLSGYITAMNVHTGSYARSEDELYELVDMDHMHLEMNVFEQDISKIEVGQQIRFTVPSLGETIYHGEVFLLGKSFAQENKTLQVHGHIKGNPDNFIRGLYIEAKIYTGNQRVLALPEEAIVEDEGKSYIFIRTEGTHAHAEESGHAEEDEHAKESEHTEEEEEHTDSGEAHGTSFQRVQVEAGEKDQGFVQIKQMPEVSEGAKIVVKGAYYLFSEMKKGEGGHHHH